MNRNHSLGYDPVASFDDCLPRFKSKRGKENASAKSPRKKPELCGKRDMDEGRQRSRTRPGRHCGKPVRRNRNGQMRVGEKERERERKTERGSRAKAATVQKPLSSALPSDEIVGNRDFPVCRRVTECRFEVVSRLPRKIGQRARIEETSAARTEDDRGQRRRRRRRRRRQEATARHSSHRRDHSHPN